MTDAMIPIGEAIELKPAPARLEWMPYMVRRWIAGEGFSQYIFQTLKNGVMVQDIETDDYAVVDGDSVFIPDASMFPMKVFQSMLDVNGRDAGFPQVAKVQGANSCFIIIGTNYGILRDINNVYRRWFTEAGALAAMKVYLKVQEI